MGVQAEKRHTSMKVFIVLPALLAFASVSDSPNRLHGARGVIGHPIAHGIAHPVAHTAYAAPAYAAPVVHAAPAYHAPVVHAAAGYAVPDLAEVSPYAYNYAVADD